MIMEAGFDGLDTYRQIVRAFPDQKAVIASGFSKTKRVEEAQRLGAGAFVRKPYTLQRLGRAVRKELDRP
jgi:DNA-binding NarL/FixJ family response regulator